MSIKKEIKNNLLEKVLEENKVNEFIRSYFKIGEIEILDIYEGLLNNIFKSNKNNEDVIKEILLLLKWDWGFLLDNIFSVFRPADSELGELLFEKLNLKKDSTDNKGVILLSESIFSHDGVSDFFRNINELKNTYYSFEKAFFKKEITLLDGEEVSLTKETERNFIKENSSGDLDEDGRKAFLANYKNEIAKIVEETLINRYRDELNKKLKVFFEDSLQSTITREVGILNDEYITPRLDKTYFTHTLNNIIGNYKTKKAVYDNELNKKSTGETQKKIYKAKSDVFWSRINQLDDAAISIKAINAKEEAFSVKAEETVRKIVARSLKGGFGKSSFQGKGEKNIIRKIEEIFNSVINYDLLDGEVNDVYDYYLRGKVLSTPKNPLPNLLNFSVTEKDEKWKIHTRKVELKKSFPKYTSFFFKNYKKDIQDYFDNVLTATDILQYYLVYIKKDKKHTYKEFPKVDATFRKVEFQKELMDMIENDKDCISVVDKKIEQGISKEEYLTPFDINKEKARRKELFYKLFSLVYLTEFYFVIEDKVKDIEKNAEIKYLLAKIINSKKEMKYDEYILSGSKKTYETDIYKVFKNQAEYLETFTDFFFSDTIIFKDFFVNYVLLFWKHNIPVLKKLKVEFDIINPSYSFAQNTTEKVHLFSYRSKQKETINKINSYLKTNKISPLLEDATKDNINMLLRDISSKSKISILYFIDYILRTSNLEILIEEAFLGVVIGEKIFVFFSSPTFEVMNQIIIYFENNHQKKEKVFILTNPNFYFYLNESFQANVSLPGIQHEFKRVLEYSYYNTKVSDISIFGSKSQKTGYILIREDKIYNLVKFSFGSQSSSILLYKDIEKILENIISLWWAITESKVVDGAITIGWEQYRLSILRDGDNTAITFRAKPRGHPTLSPLDLRKKYNIEYDNKLLVNVAENVTLEQSYGEDDIKLFKRLALQDEGMFLIAGKTGSGKSVSIRNLLNFIFDKRIEEKNFPKIITLEDPIEQKNLNFTQLNAKGDELLSFIKWLKRADPDMLLLWELRSYEMLIDALEFASMLWVTSTLHATSVLTTLDLLGSWAIRAEVWLADVLRKVKCILSQKLLSIRKPKISLEEGQKSGALTLLTRSEKKAEAELTFREYFSNYIGEDIKFIEVMEEINFEDDVPRKGLTRLLSAKEKHKRYQLWLDFKANMDSDKWTIIWNLTKEAKGVKLYYEFADQSFLKDNLNMFLELGWKDSPLKTLEEQISLKLTLKEEVAFLDLITGNMDISSYLTLSADLTPHVYYKLKKIGKI